MTVTGGARPKVFTQDVFVHTRKSLGIHALITFADCFDQRFKSVLIVFGHQDQVHTFFLCALSRFCILLHISFHTKNSIDVIFCALFSKAEVPGHHTMIRQGDRRCTKFRGTFDQRFYRHDGIAIGLIRMTMQETIFYFSFFVHNLSYSFLKFLSQVRVNYGRR